MQLGLRRNEGFRWFTRDSVFAKGYLHDAQNRHFKDEGLLEYFSGVVTRADFVERLQAANGCFAVVIRRDDMTLAAVDRVRSIPLFYGQAGDHLVLSDDAFWLADQLRGLDLDPVSGSEFLLTGYVLGNDTLCESVKQLQAGQWLVGTKSLTDVAFYYKHVHGHFLDQGEPEHFSDLDTVYRNVFGRLVESAAGRTLAVPLSGGYDSRLIVAMLRALEYSNVVCFTYGQAGCAEASTAKRVAKALGYPWHFIEYNEERWRAYTDCSAYAVFASNLASLPQMEFFPALRELKHSALVPADAIVVPGFCGDLQGGSYVPDAVVANRPQRMLRSGLVEHVCRTYLRLKNEVPDAHMESIKTHIAGCLSDFPEGRNVEEFISSNEAFFTNQKVAKFVINALRACEFFNYEWRLPLWDNEFAAHWYHIPYTERIGDRLYDRHLMKSVFEPLNIAFHKKKGPLEERARLIARRVFSSHMMEVLMKLYATVNPRRRGLIHLNAYPSLMRILAEDLRRRGHRTHYLRSATQCYAYWYLCTVHDLYGNRGADPG